ncbi:MAG: chemotaxis protein CheB [Mastigocoleus sp. MO_167.B18]|nr:chemotaxis protein CheB [Mastigocoleus sp. MO_167.B18]
MSASKSNKKHTDTTESQKNKDFFVVGIGASAGGLSPLQEFFEYIPTDSGAAFVVVQHLSPDFKSLMKELLGRKTRMEIYRVEDGMNLEPNSIYLIPPGQNLVVKNRSLQLHKQNRQTQKPNFPIDLFFKSLATDCGEKAIAVVLSGTGSDASHGVRLIHEAGGLSIVQDPNTAQFDGMLVSAIDTGVVDYILPPVEISKLIYQCLTSSNTSQSGFSNLDTNAGSDSFKIQQIINVLARHEQIDFSHYKTSTLSRRINRRCLILGCENFDDYINRLQIFPQERELLRNDLLISVTAFFRDAPAWEYLETTIIPSLLKEAKPGEELRFWVTACATGQEAYSLAMLLDEAINELEKNVKIKIFATDLDQIALEKATNGIYPATIANDISPERLRNYFIYRDQSFQVSRKLREMLIFAPHDLTKDAGFTRMHLVTCRNVLIYMQPQLQQQVLRNLHFSLVPNGILFLGEAETVSEYEDEFISLDKKWKIFQKRREIRLPIPVQGIEKISRDLIPQSNNSAKSRLSKEQMLDIAFNSFLQEHKTTCLLVNTDNQIIHFFQDVLSVLRLPLGNPTMEVTKLVPLALQLPLNTALHRAKREKRTVCFNGIDLNSEDENRNNISVNLKVSYHPGNKIVGDFISITISESDPVHSQFISDQSFSSDSFEVDRVAHARIMELEYELRETRENLQVTIEELETTNEEQQATNEELIASNEELQSTNEELHSVNEELHTVNSEYQSKIQQLIELNNDVNNLLSSTNFGVVFLDEKLQIRKFTAAATVAINLKEGDIGRSLEDITHNTNCSNFRELILQVLETELPIETEIKQIKNDTYLLMQINPYRQEDGNIDGVVITFVDVDELKTVQEQIFRVNDALRESEHSLRKSEERFRAIFEQAAVGIAQLSTDGTWLKVNQKVCEITGYSEEKLLELNFQDITYPEDLEKDLEQVKLLLAGEISSYSLEKRYIRQNGTLVWVNITPSLVPETAESPKYFIAIIEDISDRKQAEARLKEASQALTELTERYELAVTGSGDGIWDWNLITGYSYLSPRWKEILGYKDDEISNHADSFFSYLHPEDKPKVEQAIKQHFEHSTPFDIECRLQNKQNEYVWIRNRGQAIRNESGTPVRMSGSISDITHLKNVEENLRQANHQLAVAKESAEAANQAKSEFLAKMTHELRTPLNSILGFTQILHRQPNLEEQQRKYLDTVLRCSNHLLNLINDILDISKIEAGAVELNAREFDLYSIIESLKQMFQIKSKSKGLQLNVEFSEDVPQYIRTDEARLRQVLINLLGNAIKFTDTGNVVLQIIKDTITKDIIPELTYPHTNNKVNSCDLTFRIKDTGKGIAEENLSNIFDAFVQAGNNQEYCDGTGLGLAISKNYVDLMGGHMQIQSSLGKGTTVEFDIPITIIPKEEFVESLPKGRIVCLEPEQLKPLILIAEDNSDNHQLLFEILSEVGFKTIQAYNGQEAVEKWREYKPDLVLMDMQMPVMNGYQATREIKSTTEGKNTTIIIAQTSNAFNEDKKLIMSLGCDDFISKPFQEQILLEKVAYHLGVKYTYSNEKQDLEPENLPIQITPESLAFMSDKWRFQLHQIASTCNKKDILKILAEIPEDNSSNSQVKQYLMSLANKFLFDVIVDLTAPLEEINSR